MLVFAPRIKIHSFMFPSCANAIIFVSGLQHRLAVFAKQTSLTKFVGYLSTACCGLACVHTTTIPSQFWPVHVGLVTSGSV